MKKFCLFLMLLVSFSLSAERRCINEVMDIAKPFLKHKKAQRCMPSHEVLNLSAEQTDEAFYVVTADGADGFVIVSADTEMPTVLAVSDKPFIQDRDRMPEGMKLVLESYNEMYNRIASGKEQTEDIIPVYHKQAAYPDAVAPLLGGIEYDQGDPFNRLCPAVGSNRTLTGCVATALSMIMRYYRYPSVGKGTYHFGVEDTGKSYDVDISTLPFDWSKIRENYRRGEYTEEEADAVAKLLYAVGAAIGMDYGFAGSGASSKNVKSTMINAFDYKSDMVYVDYEGNQQPYDDWVPTIQEELIAKRPVYFSGSKGGVGHAFVLDGYMGNYTGSDMFDPSAWVEAVLFHVNWGYSGEFNGYFHLNYLRQSDERDDKGAYKYDNYGAFRCQFVIGLQPSHATAITEQQVRQLSDGTIYDILGRVVNENQLQQGMLYIQDGKKFIFR